MLEQFINQGFWIHGWQFPYPAISSDNHIGSWEIQQMLFLMFLWFIHCSAGVDDLRVSNIYIYIIVIFGWRVGQTRLTWSHFEPVLCFVPVWLDIVNLPAGVNPTTGSLPPWPRRSRALLSLALLAEPMERLALPGFGSHTLGLVFQVSRLIHAKTLKSDSAKSAYQKTPSRMPLAFLRNTGCPRDESGLCVHLSFGGCVPNWACLLPTAGCVPRSHFWMDVDVNCPSWIPARTN